MHDRTVKFFKTYYKQTLTSANPCQVHVSIPNTKTIFRMLINIPI